MDGDLHDGAGLDLSHTASSELVLSLLTNVDVAVDLGTTTGIDNVGSDLVVSDDGSILLARVDGGTVASNGRVDW